MSSALPETLRLPNTIRRSGFVWGLLAAHVTLVGGMMVVLAVAGQWLAAALFAFTFAVCCFQSWLYFTERLTLDANGFEYRLGNRRWTVVWPACASIAPAGNVWDGRHRIVIRWVGRGPEFVLQGDRQAEEAATHSALGMKPAALAALMNGYRDRAAKRKAR